jgi:hypothetical protein
METRRTAINLILSLVASSACTFAVAGEEPDTQLNTLADYDAQYIVEKYDSQIARLKYSLRQNNQQITYSTSATLTGIVSLFRSDTATERSVLRNTQPATLTSYHYTQTGSDKKRNVDFQIDWDTTTGVAHGITADKTFELEVTKPVWDPLSFQLALMRDINPDQLRYSYQVIHRGEIKTYIFTRQQDDVLEIDEIFYDTVLLQREHNGRLTKFWLAKDYQYVPLQIERYKNNKLETRITLDSVNIHE